jgi:hypothetical protein
MKITSSGEKNYITEANINKPDIPQNGWMMDGFNGSENNEMIKTDKGKDILAAKKVLTTNEMSTLHLLFGSNKPDEMSFYGQNKVQPINKGQFVDIFG